jgi:hypothetical protein
MLRYIFLFVAAGLIPTAAVAQPYTARVAQACASMGLTPSEAPYAFCEMSLRDNVAAVAEARGIGAARRQCAGKGYRIGTPSFANCVLDRDENFSAAGGEGAPAMAEAGEGAFQSYQRGDQRKSVRRACADIGLDPGSSAFASCVGNLNTTMDDSNMVGSD